MNLLIHRFHTQHLAGTPLKRPEDVVRSLAAVQSQDHLGAKWSVGQRIRNGTDAAVQQAFDDGRILRTHVLRPTWHYVTPDDIRWMLALTAPRVHALSAFMYRQSELTPGVLARGAELIARALEAGAQLTRAEIAALLGRHRIKADGVRLGYLVMWSELEGLICSGAMRGKQHTYALLALRAPRARVLSRAEAVAELVQRFFTSHAPATLDHFLWWSGLTRKDAHAGLAAVKRELVSEMIGGREFWYGPGGPPLSRLKGAWLIPEYDEVLTRYEDLGASDLAASVASGKWEDRFLRPVIVDGRRAGSWRRDVVKSGVVLRLNLFARLSVTQERAVRRAAIRYAEFLGLPLVR